MNAELTTAVTEQQTLSQVATNLYRCRKASGPINAVSDRRKRFLALKKVAGIERWPQDSMRHSYASYSVAQYRDPESTAFEMGHKNGVALL